MPLYLYYIPTIIIILYSPINIKNKWYNSYTLWKKNRFIPGGVPMAT